MITIIDYVSNNMAKPAEDVLPLDWFEYLANTTSGENILIGNMTYTYEYGSVAPPTVNTYILSRKQHRKAGVHYITNPSKFREGYVLGGYTTIAAMTPFADRIILGVSYEEQKFGTRFPMFVDNWELKSSIYLEKFVIREYVRN